MVLVVAVGGGAGETGLWRSASAAEDQISSLQVGGGVLELSAIHSLDSFHL